MAISLNCITASFFSCCLCTILPCFCAIAYPLCIICETIGIGPIQMLWCICKLESICLICFGCCDILFATLFFISAQICRYIYSAIMTVLGTINNMIAMCIICIGSII